MGATIKDVAKLANVSIATVSRVINEKGVVAPEKEQRVLAAVKELSYTPNVIAQSLKQKKSRLVGMMCSDLSVSFFTGVQKVLEKELFGSGYQIIVANTYDSPSIERQLIQLMTQGRCDILLVNTTGANDDLLAQVRSQGTQLLGYDRFPQNGADYPSVYLDKVQGTYKLLRYLYDLGHRKMCLVMGAAQLSTSVQRRQGVELFLQEKGLPQDSVIIREKEFTEEFGIATLEEMRALAEPPTAYIAGSVAITVGMVKYCESHGLSLPEDLSLATFGNFRHAELVKPTLMHVDDEYEKVARQLLEWIRIIDSGEGSLPTENVALEPRLILGASCGPAPNRI